MSAFWIAGIGINIVVLAAVAWWAVRNWKGSTERRTGRNDGSHM